MSFEEELFDDSLDELLAGISVSQLDPTLNNQSNGKQLKTIDIQTDYCFANYLKNSKRRKRKIRVVKTHKHHHKPCVYHQESSGLNSGLSGHLIEQTVNQSFNSQTASHSKNGINDNYNKFDSSHYHLSHSENKFKISSNETITEAVTSSQFELITNQDFSSSDNSSQTITDSDNTIENNLSQKSIQLISDSNVLSSQSSNSGKSNEKSFNLLETDDDSDAERSPLHQLAINDNTSHERQLLKTPKNELIADEELLKTQNSEASSNSSQNSIFSFYEY